MPEHSLSQTTVSEIRNLIVEKPSLIKKNAVLNEIIAAIVKDPRSRHAYVVDDTGKLLGSIRLNSIIECMFPFSAFETEIDVNSDTLFQFKQSILAMDIMNKQPIHVYETTTIPEIVKIMVKEKINELPVVDQSLHVIGEVNFLEIMIEFLKIENNREK
ncbi:MAG: CBS domain-containing protein [Spirochaetes bacterium]|nr:CBS domain-containing protein [Spirochaetota bacterium]